MSINFAPREITFLHEGQELSTSQVFETLYGSLQRVIQENFQRYINNLDRKAIHNNFHKEERKKFESERADITARIKFDDSSFKDYFIIKRTNFDISSMKKSPSMVYLRSEKNDFLILREARRYHIDEVNKKMSKEYQNKFDKEGTAQFYSGEKIPFKKDVRNKKVTLLPENNLTLALERLYENTDIPRFTPKPFILSESEPDKIWYLREFVSLAQDVNLDLENLGNYLGTVNALGLMENLDRQLVHYYITQKGNLGNYDPDFITHCNNDIMVTNQELADVKDAFRYRPSSEDVSHLMDEVKKYRNKTINQLNKNGITNQTIVQYLNQTTKIEDFEEDLVLLPEHRPYVK